MVIVDDVAQVVSAAVMGFAHAHRVVREVDITVIAWEASVEVVESPKTRAGAKVEGSLQKTVKRISRAHREDHNTKTYISAS